MWAGLCDGPHSLGRWHPTHIGPWALQQREVASWSTVVDNDAPLSWPAWPDTPAGFWSSPKRDINTSEAQNPKSSPSSPSTVLTVGLVSICHQNSLHSDDWREEIVGVQALQPGPASGVAVSWLPVRGLHPPPRVCKLRPWTWMGSHRPPWILFSLGMVAHICNAGTWEAEAELPLV